MIYVIGTGRCGTGSMAIKLNGLHEPNPRLHFPFRLRYEGFWDRTYQKWTLDILKARAKLNTPAICDMYQSLFIDEISLIDPTAEFIWLIRKKDDCVESMVRRKTNCLWETKEKANHFYNYINHEIEQQLKGKSYEILATESIGDIKVNTFNEPLEGTDFR